MLIKDQSARGGVAREPDDAEAFRALVANYEPWLARYIRFRIPGAADAEDVLQNTLIAAWVGFRDVRNPDHMQAWLLNVAKNRCRDYFRARERAEVPLLEETYERFANRFGLHQHRTTQGAADVIDAFEAAPTAVREAARQFYVERLTIPEIAAISGRPAGTVKRQLFQARQVARVSLGIQSSADKTYQEKNMLVQAEAATGTSIKNPMLFPAQRPEIRVAASADAFFDVDCRELRSWPIVPVIGNDASCAEYVPPGWKLQEVTTLQALRLADVHDVPAVEIVLHAWKPVIGWQRPGAIYARLTDISVEFLAVHLPQENFTQIETFLDESFGWDWGAVTRKISGFSAFERNPDGSLIQREPVEPTSRAAIPVDVVDLEIGNNRFHCLRVLESSGERSLAECRDFLTESYLTREGRSLLTRRYCHPDFLQAARFTVIADEMDTLVIDDIAFLHCSDTLTNLAL